MNNRILLLLFILFLFVTTYLYEKNIIYIKIKKYKLCENSYINGVFFQKQNKQIILHCYSLFLTINISKCELQYKNEKKNCNVSLHHFWGMEKTFFMITVSINSSIKPLYIIINKLKITIPSTKNMKYRYVVCARMIFNYTKSNYLIQYFESLKYFGVSKVVSYFTSASSDVIKILSHYVFEGLLDLYKYDEEMEIKWKNIYYGEVGKLNHCFQQYKEVSKYIMEFDYDEILWPVKGNNYDDIFNKLPKYDVYFTHSRFYIINNTSYIFDINRTIVEDVNMFTINVSCQTYNGFTRKYIISNSKKVIALEVHRIVAHLGVKSTYINPKIAYLRHTRKIAKGIIRSCKNYYTNTKTVLENNIERIINKVKLTVL